MLSLLEMCQIRPRDVSLQFSKASKLHGALRDYKRSWKVTLPQRAGHRGSDACLIAAAKHQSRGCRLQKVGEGADGHADARCQESAGELRSGVGIQER